MSKPEFTFREFLGYCEPDEILTEEILLFLETLNLLSNKDVKVVARLTSGEIARLISSTREDLKRKSMGIAIKILTRLSDAGYHQKDDVETKTQEIILKPVKQIGQMGLKDLILLCRDEPDKKREAWRFLIKKEEYISATKRTTALAWLVEGTLDVDRTTDYIFLMGDPLTTKQTPKREKGEKLISLAEALGIETRCYVHPLSGAIIRGRDHYGIEWIKELSPEYHLAAIWSLVDRECNLHPGDSYNNAQELLEGKGVWSLIVAQYWQALDEGKSLAKSISIYTEPVKKNKVEKTFHYVNQSPKTPEYEESHHREMLTYHSSGNEKYSGYNKDVVGIYDHLRITGYNMRLKRVVCLEGLNISGYNVKGTIILPPGGKVKDTGYNNDLNIERCKSWREVAARADLI